LRASTRSFGSRVKQDIRSHDRHVSRIQAV
jgi:hypothetical protein